MKQKFYLIAGIVFFALTLATSCQGEDAKLSPEVATVVRSAPSLSGKYVLHVVANDKEQPSTVTFEIRAENGDLVFTPTETFDNRHTTFFLWGNEDRVWVYSGDLGTFFWEHQAGMWKKFLYANADVSAPSFLKEQRPRWHKK